MTRRVVQLTLSLALLLSGLSAAQETPGYLGISHRDAVGIGVTTQESRSPLRRAGARRGDVVVALGSTVLTSAESWSAGEVTGRPVVLRRGKLKRLRREVTFTASPDHQQAWGAAVDEVETNTSAADAKLQQGDVIVALGKRLPIRSSEALKAVLGETRPGQRLRVTFVRAGVTEQVEVVLGRPEVNPFIRQVDAEIEEPEVRAAIRSVQPACVAVGRSRAASGVNLSPEGLILTAAHVSVDRAGALKLNEEERELLKARLRLSPVGVEFPGGVHTNGIPIAIDLERDLLLIQLKGQRDLPYALLASETPAEGIPVVCIGQPGEGGHPDPKPWHVSRGRLLGPSAEPALAEAGYVRHSAWTWYGHSGSPLLDHTGRVVGIHALWHSTRGERLGASHARIRAFLEREGIQLPSS